MKKFIMAICTGVVLFSLAFVIFAEDQPIGKVTFPLGDVKLQRKKVATWDKVKLGTKVFSGDHVKTGKESRCEITLNDGSVIRIGELASFAFTEAQISTQSKKSESKLNVGQVWANIKRVSSKDESFKIKSPSAVVAVRGTVYRVTAGQDCVTTVHVYQGSVEAGWVPGQVTGPTWPPKPVQGPKQVTMKEWFEIVKAQQMLTIRPDGTQEKPKTFDLKEDEKDPWVKWNKERDMALESAPPAPADTAKVDTTK